MISCPLAWAISDTAAAREGHHAPNKTPRPRRMNSAACAVRLTRPPAPLPSSAHARKRHKASPRHPRIWPLGPAVAISLTPVAQARC